MSSVSIIEVIVIYRNIADFHWSTDVQFGGKYDLFLFELVSE